MGKWGSEIVGLPSKEQLKAFRRQMLNQLMADDGLSLDEYPFWDDDTREAQVELFRQADSDYEERKADLRKSLNNLKAEERAVYFQEIGLDEQDPDEWLAPSPA